MTFLPSSVMWGIRRLPISCASFTVCRHHVFTVSVENWKCFVAFLSRHF